MNIRKLLPIILLVLILIGLSACTPAAVNETVTEESAPTDEIVTAEPTKELVEIEFYFSEGFGKEATFDKMIAAFEAKYPYIKVNKRINTWTEFRPSLPIMWASDKVSDVIDTNGPDIREFAYYGVLLPLDDIFPESELKNFAPSVVEEVSYNGHIYGAPYTDSVIPMFYNKDMFAAAGVEAPTSMDDPWTWDEWLTNIQKVVDVAEEAQGRKIWGLVGLQNPPIMDYWVAWIPRSAGEKGSPTFMGISEDGTTLHGYLDTPESLAALQFYQRPFSKV